MFIKVNDAKNGWFKFSNGKQNNLVYIIRFQLQILLDRITYF